MKEAGPFTIELFPQAAPLTAAQFAKLAESGYYDGLTFHRIAPNFVLQGGSPGANEFEGRPEYIRDEVGLAVTRAWNTRYLDPRSRYRRQSDLHQPRGQLSPGPQLHGCSLVSWREWTTLIGFKKAT